MKSAYEIAMSRLEKSEPTRKLTEEQKAQLAEIDSEINAKIAERKLFLEDRIAQSADDLQALEELRRQLALELARLEESRESRKEAVRQG